MALNIRNQEAERLATELAQQTGESKTKRHLVDELLEIANHFASLPVLDDRTPDEILGYDENGLPT